MTTETLQAIFRTSTPEISKLNIKTTAETRNTTKNNDGSNTLELWRSQPWFTENYLQLVNPHWLEFAPPPKAAHQFLAVLYAFIMSAGIFGNTLVIFMFIRCRSLRTPANILVTNLAVSDLTMMIKMPVFIYNSVYQGIALGETGCEIYGFIGGLTGTVSICTLAAIALDRYYVVVYPLNRASKTLRSKISVTIAWIYGIIFSAIPLLKVHHITYVPEGYLTSCSFDYLTNKEQVRIFIVCYFVAAWVIPFIIISICYSKILAVVMQARNIGKKMTDPAISARHYKEQEQKKKDIRLALVVLGIIALWFVAWTPYAVVALLGIAGYKNLLTPLTSMIPALFCKVASCLDPFVYAVTNQRFKDELKAVFCKHRADKENTLKKVWSTNASRQATIRGEASSEDSVEEVVVMMEISSAVKSKDSTMLDPSSQFPKPEENVNISNVGKLKRASWVFRPNFSNRSSSLRSMARTWNKSRDSSFSEEQTTM